MSGSKRAQCLRRSFLAVTVLAVSLAGPWVHGQPAEGGEATAIGQVVWTSRAPMSVPRTDFGAAVVNNKVYAIGGFSGSTLSLVEEYDPANDSWTRKANMPTPRRLLVVVAANGKIYAIGGAAFTNPNALTYSFATEKFDPVANTWATRADIPLDPPSNNVLGNLFIGGTVVEGRIYVVAFNTNTPGTTATYEYDPEQDVWNTDRAPVPFSYTRYSVASLNGRIYVLGTGQIFGPAPFAEYDPSMDLWVIKPSPSIDRGYHSLAAAANRLHAIGGLSLQGALGTVETFYPDGAAWRAETPLMTPRHSAGSAVVGRRIYVIGGANGSGVPLASVESRSLRRRAGRRP